MQPNYKKLMNKSLIKILLLCFALLPFTGFAQKSTLYNISLDVTDKDNGEPVIMASVRVEPTGNVAVTDMNGHAVINGLERGEYTVSVSYVGYDTRRNHVVLDKDVRLKVKMEERTLGLREVSVVARQKTSGAATSNVIGRQAIDHLQAASLADIMQLIPGQTMQNTDLTSQKNLQLRTLANNNTAAFGSRLIVDGVPQSNDGNLEAGGFSATAFAGTDLRNYSADDVEEVEVIRGIPSAEYGDLTSGLVVVHSKTGVTPWQVKGKVNPGMMNYSVGKGLKMDRYGVLNLSLDYAQAWGDPREKTRSFDRYTLALGYGLDINSRWHTDTKLRVMEGKDWSGNDPDALQDGTESKNNNRMVSLSHTGKIRGERLLSRTLSYTVGLTLTSVDNSNTKYVPTTNGVIHIVTARETGYNEVDWLNHSYLATGRTESSVEGAMTKAMVKGQMHSRIHST